MKDPFAFYPTTQPPRQKSPLSPCARGDPARGTARTPSISFLKHYSPVLSEAVSQMRETDRPSVPYWGRRTSVQTSVVVTIPEEYLTCLWGSGRASWRKGRQTWKSEGQKLSRWHWATLSLPGGNRDKWTERLMSICGEEPNVPV